MLHRATAKHIEVLKSERAALRDLQRLGVESTTFDEGRFGRPSMRLGEPATLEHSRYRIGDRAIVFVERAIDAVAFEQKHQPRDACYVYTGDSPKADVKQKVAHMLAGAPPELKVVLAFARDRRGTDLAEQVLEIAGHRQVERRAPEYGTRWADEMQIKERHRASLALVATPAPTTRDPVLQHAHGEIARALDAGVDPVAIKTAILRRPPKGLDR